MQHRASRTKSTPTPAEIAQLGTTTRRSFVVGTSAAAVLSLTACSGEGPKSVDVDPGTKLGPVSEIPVGSGKLYLEGAIIVTQPTEGEYVGLSAICTHQQCTVREVNGPLIYCGCHGSEFDLDGQVVEGPATKPLPSRAIQISHDQVFTA